MIIHTEIVKLFTYAELSETAKESIRQSWEAHFNTFGYDWEKENYNSAKAAFDALKVQADIYTDGTVVSYDCNAVDNEGDERGDRADMGFARTIAFINNHFDLKKNRFFLHKTHIIGATDPWGHLSAKYKKMALAPNHMSDNMLTGYCSDYILIETYKQFIEAAKENGVSKYNFGCFCDMLKKNFNKEYENDYEAQLSDDYIANLESDSLFTEAGEKYCNTADLPLEERKQLSA